MYLDTPFNYFPMLGLPTVNFGVKYEAQRIIYDQFRRMRSLFNTSSHEHQVDPTHKPKLSLILLRAWVGRKNDNGHLISFYIFGQLPGRHYSPLADRPCSQQATVISQQKMAGKGAEDGFESDIVIFFRVLQTAKLLICSHSDKMLTST